MVRRLISSLVAASLAVTGAEAAMLTNIQGSVTVNRGDGFQPALGGTPVAPGDRVRVSEGTADIVYDNGCVVKVGPGQMVAVLYAPPACGTTSSGSLKDPPSNTMTYAYIGGGLLLAGGIGAGTVLLLQNNNKPASP